MEEVEKIKKKCFKCKIDKELTEFIKNKEKLHGVCNICIPCLKEERVIKQAEIVKKRIDALYIDGEIWKSIPGFNKYKVSSLGRIMAVKTGKLMTPYIKNGYSTCNIIDDNGIDKNVFFHRMVGITFIPNLDAKPTINHLNKIRNDNRVENLAWASFKEQNDHKFSVNPPEKKRTIIAITNISDLENEIWKDIEGHPLYKVSNRGRVKYTIKTAGTSIIQKITEGCLTPHGYKTCSIKIGNGEKRFLIHRLVANAFLENPLQKPLVNHKNGIKHDNHLENLEFSTNSENVRHAHDTGLCSSKKEIYQLNEKNEIIKIWQSITEAATSCKITISNISHCLRGESLTAGGFWWVYANEYDINKILKIKKVKIKKIKIEKKIISINQIDIKTGNIIKIWENINDAVLYFSTQSTNNKKGIKQNINNCARNKVKSMYGYKWSYVN